jgi:hypothetical protein
VVSVGNLSRMTLFLPRALKTDRLSLILFIQGPAAAGFGILHVRPNRLQVGTEPERGLSGEAFQSALGKRIGPHIAMITIF